MPYILAFDQGTTSSRAIVFDERGAVRGVGQRELPQHFPRDGWVEHNPADIWQTQLDSAHDALRNAAVAGSDVAAIGISNQRETTTLWERATGRPIGNAIVWQDRRTAARCEALRARGAAGTIARKTGLPLDPYFSATKIAWLLDHTDGLRARAERGEIAFGTVDTWLLWNLTAGEVHATDHTNASRTSLLDLATLQWDDELLALFNIPRAILPELRPSIGAFGRCDRALFGAPIIVGGVAGDQQAALFGQAGFRCGLAKNTYGTGSFAMLNTGNAIPRSTHGLLSTVAFTTSGAPTTYALEGSVFVSGAAVQWLRDGLNIIQTAGEIETLAAQVPDSGGVYFVPALTGLGAPHWDPHARGAIYGITRGTTAAHLARATLEAMAYQTSDVISAMLRDAGIELHELRVDGGASVNDTLLQIQADILGVDVVRPRITETSALGAAYMAGLHAGIWPDLAAIENLWQPDRRFLPATMPDERTPRLEEWRSAIERTRERAR
jgi:glycerol kinase